MGQDNLAEEVSRRDVSRRTVLRGAGAAGSAAAAAAALAACGGSSPAASTGGTAGSGTAASGVTVSKADVPVGGGKVVPGAVVTQPTAGTFKAFSPICTHAGCTVSDVVEGKISCPCHGSIFDANTGSVLGGPAGAPLAAKAVTESGSNLLVS